MKKLKIVFFSLYPFDSLSDGYIAADLAQEIVNRNHTLKVITPTTNVVSKRTTVQHEKKYTHLHVASGPIQKVSSIQKMIGLLKLDFITKRYLRDITDIDLVITMVSHCAFYQSVKFLKKRNRKVIVYNLVKDIFPQNVIDLGFLKENSIGHRILKRQEENYYKISDFLGVVSPNCIGHMLNNFPFLKTDQVEFNPNTIIPRPPQMNKLDKARLKEKYGIPSNKIVFMYGGNLGVPQGIDFLVECMLFNEKRNDCFFLIIGSGTEFEKIRSIIDDNNLKNTKLFRSIARDDFSSITSCCDVGMVFLNQKFTIPNYPSRILTYMESSLPILFAVDSNCDAATIAVDNGYGYSCLNGDIDKFNSNVDRMIDNSHERANMGKKAFDFLINEYCVSRTLDLILSHL